MLNQVFGTSKRFRVDVTAAVDPIANVEPIVPPPFSLRAMMETFITTQVAHG